MFDDSWVYGSADADILRVINAGIADAGMPAFGDSLSQDVRNDLLVYIKSGRVEISPPIIKNVPSISSTLAVSDWVTGLEEPWGLVFTGPRSALVTEKSGHLRLVKDGVLSNESIANIPAVTDNGQGGLLDVAVDPDYAENGWVYLAFSDPATEGKAMTKIVRGKIDGQTWVGEQVLFEARPEHYVKSRVHFGSRITFDNDGHLFFSIGDRGQKAQAQDVSRPNGKIHRINRDGSIPGDNPFTGQAEAYETIYAFGNRNPQGLIIHPETGVLWETEHGPKGGDELNMISAGVNYGWPEISYGRNYNGTELTPHTALPGMAQPLSHWTPSIAACGLDVYSGNMFPDWQGRLLAGSLRDQTLRLIDVSGNAYQSEVIILENEGRVRDVTSGPDGAVYAALEDRIVRLAPKE